MSPTLRRFPAGARRHPLGRSSDPSSWLRRAGDRRRGLILIDIAPRPSKPEGRDEHVLEISSASWDPRPNDPTYRRRRAQLIEELQDFVFGSRRRDRARGLERRQQEI